jgi:hypothetical protein
MQNAQTTNVFDQRFAAIFAAQMPPEVRDWLMRQAVVEPMGNHFRVEPVNLGYLYVLAVGDRRHVDLDGHPRPPSYSRHPDCKATLRLGEAILFKVVRSETAEYEHYVVPVSGFEVEDVLAADAFLADLSDFCTSIGTANGYVGHGSSWTAGVELVPDYPAGCVVHLVCRSSLLD